MYYKAYNNKNANTSPINPLTSTRLNPMNDQRISVLLNTGLRLIDNNKKENISPTPTPTPANDIKGMLDAKYLNPKSIIKMVGMKQHKKLRSSCGPC
jgi:hypothetical protein